MLNPSGPYPGRQLFLGSTADGKPYFAYLVTGRSPESRQRKAVPVENTVRIGPLGNTTYDPLRHYTAVKYDNGTGVVAITNGIQSEAIYEAYRLIVNVGTPPTEGLLEELLESANAEPDSLHTPPIGGAIIASKGSPVFVVGIKTHATRAVARQAQPGHGWMSGISTYKGNMDNPEPTDPAAPLSRLECKANTPLDIAQFVWDISAASNKGDDIRVCAVSGIYHDSAWVLHIINKHSQ
jgi:IMP cyclohydrolase